MSWGKSVWEVESGQAAKVDFGEDSICYFGDKMQGKEQIPCVDFQRVIEWPPGPPQSPTPRTSASPVAHWKAMLKTVIKPDIGLLLRFPSKAS